MPTPALDLAPAGRCVQCGGPITCRFNYFDRGDLQIHSWEHKCGDCGRRETQAYRSDAPTPSSDPSRCPYCNRSPQPA